MPLERPRFRQKLGRWYRMFFKGVVLLHRIERDFDTNGYKITTEETTRAELPLEALQVVGKKNEYAIDMINIKHDYNQNDYGFSAIDLNLWLESNTINDALALKWNGLEGLLDKRKLSMILIIGVIAVIVVYVLMAGMK